ncbi:hypothetical protein ZWY2020_019846 [Hordeum vulgare]|nr:hypothetical protein ZWY2020_019846 [Hordeum vulgare]
MEGLVQWVALLRESLGQSQAATDVVVSILGSFDSRLSTLDSRLSHSSVHWNWNWKQVPLTRSVVLVYSARALQVLAFIPTSTIFLPPRPS